MAEQRIILIVEDEDDHYELIRRGFALDPEGYVVLRARSIAEARRSISTSPPALVITDWKLPDGDGIELIARDDTGALLFPVLTMTSHGNEAWAVEAIKLGALEYIVKSPETLSAMLRSAQRALREWRNITERRQAESALRESQQRFVTFMDHLPAVVFIKDRQGRLLFANEYLKKLFGWQDCIGRLTSELLPSELAEPMMAADAQVLTYGPQVIEETVVAVDGAEHVFETRKFPFFTKEGEVLLGGVALDITARKRAEKERGKLETQLRQAQKLESVGTLAGGIAHDFNNILMPIIGYTEMARASLASNDPVYACLSEVLKAGQRATELVRQILTFSRQTEHDLKPMMPHFIVKEALKLLRASIPSTIEIRQNVDPDCGVVLADPTQIHQLVMNLCTNGYHAMRETGGVLAVSLTRTEIDSTDARLGMHPGRYVRLEVSDTGHGMDAKTQERMFEPYFTTKAKGEGTGLGLAMVHGIVKSLGGHISVYSKPGQGATFQIYIPLVEFPPAPHPSIVSENISTGSEHILVVDDEEAIVDMVKRILQGLGYRVTVSTNSVAAMNIFQEHPETFDLLLTDMTMPGLTGAQLARNVLAIRPGFPVVLCTGFSELMDEEQARALGIRQFIMKPLNRKELAMAIRKALDGGEVSGGD